MNLERERLRIDRECIVGATTEECKMHSTKLHGKLFIPSSIVF